ncbi:hypothetical protein STCU_02393 [Strigomonas culicis]|nr:hypothetical protein STCU_04058 [Strigomonas culicis]EPY33235.1 hypothetical protein STCU_02393 [Strigomonas culicis]|eukprot:EPY30454.1 hypothetical protein STCU_04058 [Strigomonas culicis]
MVPREATVQEIIDQVIIENQSPYLCTSAIRISIDGKELDPSNHLSAYDINEHSQIDAIEENDHLLHTDAARPHDWNTDEMTNEALGRSPYREMGMEPTPNLVPRYEGKPPGYKGLNNFSGMKQSS